MASVTSSIEQLPPPKRKPKKKKKNKEPKLDLANIMKLSGIGDDDDIHFESDTSESALSSENQSAQQNVPKPSKPEPIPTPTTSEVESHITFPKRLGNIHISAVTQDISKISQNTTQTNAILEKHFMQSSQISVQQSLSDINAINQNLTQIGILNQNSTQNFLNNITGSNSVNVCQTSTPNLLNQDNQSLANFLQALNQNPTFLNGQSIPQSVIPVSSIPGLTTFASSAQSTTLTSSYQKFAIPTQTTNANFGASVVSSLVSTPPNITVSESMLNLPKITSFSQSQPPKPNSSTGHILTPQNIQGLTQNTQTSTILSNQIQNLNHSVSGLTNTPFNISNPLSNIQVQNFGNQNLFLNQGTNTIIAPNIPNFSGNITINNGLIPNANLTLPNNIVSNFLPTNIVQQSADHSFAGSNMQRTGGFKLALSEDGRLILQHDPTLNQDIQSQLLLQSIFGINIPGNNLLLSSVNNATTAQQQQQPQQQTAPQQHHQPLQHPPQPQILQPQHSKPIAVVEPKKQEVSTKTTNIIQNSIPSVRTEPQTDASQPPTGGASSNFSYIVNLTPEQLETLKRNGQLTVNGQTIFMHRPRNQEGEKTKSSPKTKTIKKKTLFEGKNAKVALQEHLNVKTSLENKTVSSVATQSTNSSLISALQSPAKNAVAPQVNPQTILPPGGNQANIESRTPQEFETVPQNVVCVQPNNSKILNPVETMKIEHSKKPINKKPEPLILMSENLENKHQDCENKRQSIEKPDIKKEEIRPHVDNAVHNEIGVNVEQFLNNLNINPANLGHLISQKLPSGVDHKIVNISQDPTAGHIVAKIDISSENIQQILSQPADTPNAQISNNNVIIPPLVSMKSEPSETMFNGKSVDL